MDRWNILLLTLFCLSNTINGLKDMTQMVVKRAGKSDAECQTACKSETLIKCHYYKFVASTQTCLLSQSDHPATEKKDKPQGYDSAALKKVLQKKRDFQQNELSELRVLKEQMNELDFKVKNFKKMKADMEKTLQDLEVRNSREGESKHAYLQMKARMEKLMQISLLMQNEISQLMHHRSTNNRDLRLLRQSKDKADLDIETISNKMEKLQSYLAAVRKSDDSNKNELDQMREKQDQMIDLMRHLRRKVHSTKAEIKSNPLIMKILNNQKMLADGLQDMENKLSQFDKKQVSSDQTYDELYGRVLADEGERKSLANSISTVERRVKSIQDDVKRIDNPQSSANMEKLRTVTTLKNDVSLLKRSNEDLEKNIKRSHTELESLIKDLVNIKLSDQSNKAGITAVALAHRHTQQVFESMRKDQSEAFNKIRVLEEVYKRILEVVHNIEVHQVQLKQDISHFDDSINSIDHHLSQNLVENQGESLEDRASALGVALDKLTSESASSLSKENLTPIGKLGEGSEPNKEKNLEKKMNSIVKDRANQQKLVDQVQKVIKVRHRMNEATEQGKPIHNSLAEKIQVVRDNITKQLKPDNAEELMVEQLAQQIMGPTPQAVIKNKTLKKELAKRKSSLTEKEGNAQKMTPAEKKMPETTKAKKPSGRKYKL